MRFRLLLAIVPAALLVYALLLGARWILEATLREQPLPPPRESLELFRVSLPFDVLRIP